jgi:glycosyltransferase involved in cell wall biosynthesis
MISVIMISYLGDYKGARKDPEAKFIRAVNSFISQEVPADCCELIIVSDGCQKTNRLYLEHFQHLDNITLVKMEKSKNEYPGEYRQIGIERAKFNTITYLDADDFLLPSRLKNCIEAIESSGRILVLDTIYNVPVERKEKIGTPIACFEKYGILFDKLEIEWNSGTFQFVHRKEIEVKWSGRSSRGEDHLFFKNMSAKYNLKPAMIRTRIDGYVVCHHPNFGFDV